MNLESKRNYEKFIPRGRRRLQPAWDPATGEAGEEAGAALRTQIIVKWSTKLLRLSELLCFGYPDINGNLYTKSSLDLDRNALYCVF